MRILAVDPGEKNLGIAISDPTGTIANPLTVLKHVARPFDASEIAKLAQEHEASLIVVGQVLEENGTVGFQGRKAIRMAEALRVVTSIPVTLWDESDSTQEARRAKKELFGSRHLTREHLDEIAATVILQSYLDSHQSGEVSDEIKT